MKISNFASTYLHGNEKARENVLVRSLGAHVLYTQCVLSKIIGGWKTCDTVPLRFRLYLLCWFILRYL